MKVYTKKGDDGTTGLYGGGRMSKADLRIEAFGALDELNTYVGWLIDKLSDEYAPSKSFLRALQNEIFVLGSHLACMPDKQDTMKLPAITVSLVEQMETEIDGMDEQLEPMKFFILPGGHEWVSLTHVNRVICRRAERHIIRLSQNKEEKVDPHCITFLNRLSDYFFVLARYIGAKENASEIPWVPVKS